MKLSLTLVAASLAVFFYALFGPYAKAAVPTEPYTNAKLVAFLHGSIISRRPVTVGRGSKRISCYIIRWTNAELLICHPMPVAAKPKAKKPVSRTAA